MMPRVCVVASLYHPSLGGLGRQAQQLTESLRRRGVELFVLTRLLEGAPPASYAAEVELIRLRAPRSGRHVLEERSLPNLVTSLAFSLRAAATLWRLRHRYDLAHFHGSSLPLFVALPVLRRAGKIVVAKVAAANLGTEVGDLRGRYLGFGSFLARHGRRVDTYVAISEQIRRGLLADRIPPERVVSLGNFVDTEMFRPATAAERAEGRRADGLDDCFVVITAGRLVARKGFETLVTAFGEVAARLPKARLLIVGEGPERGRLEAIADRRHGGDRVRFLGEISSLEVYLRAADLFVLPSLREGMPNALLEAMASGVPAVASRIGGVEDLEHAGGGIVLVAPGDARELAAAISSLAGSAAEREHLAEASLRTVRARYSLETRTEEYLELYRELAEGRGGRSREGSSA